MRNGLKQRSGQLKPPAASSKDQEKNDYQQDEVEATATVIAEPWAHIVATATKEQQKDHENDYQSHGRSLAWVVS